MATTPEHAPRIPHIRLPDIKGAGRWVQAIWKPVGLSLAATALGLTGYFTATHGEGQNPPIRPTTGVSDTFKPPESEFVVVPAIQIETPIPPTTTATAIPKETPTPIRALTKETKVLSAETVDIVAVDAAEIQRLYQKAIAEGKNKIPIPVELGDTGQIIEYILPNGIHGLHIKNLPTGKTYNIVAPVDGKADGHTKEDNAKYSPGNQSAGVNFYPLNYVGGEYTQNGNKVSIGYGFPVNATIKPKFWASNDQPRNEFKAEQVLASFTVNPPDSIEQRGFESMFGEYNSSKGSAMAIGFMTLTGVNKQPISMSDVFLTDNQGRPVILK